MVSQSWLADVVDAVVCVMASLAALERAHGDAPRAELMRRSQDADSEKHASPRKGPKSPSRAKSPWMPYGMAKALVQSMAFKSKVTSHFFRSDGTFHWS